MTSPPVPPKPPYVHPSPTPVPPHVVPPAVTQEVAASGPKWKIITGLLLIAVLLIAIAFLWGAYVSHRSSQKTKPPTAADAHKKSASAVVGVLQKSFKKIFSGAFFVPVPAWGIFSKKNVTVHALGGCHLAANENEGVVSAVDDGERRLGELFGYKNFFVADGSVLPSAVGANPSLTIAAVAEKINASITSDSQSQCF